MKRAEVKAAADALGRLEALEKALESAHAAPHEALPVSFFGFAGGARQSDDGVETYYPPRDDIKAYYPRELYLELLNGLIDDERRALGDMGVEP